MANGYMGKLLDVDLTKGALKDYPLTDEMCQDYIGGYGFGAKILYERIKPGIDPLGPDNVLGLLTGPMTGTPCIEGNRWVAVCKSPLTGVWGDANCGGTFGPHLKFAGYDGVLLNGASKKAVYILIEDGVASLHDAADLWGKDSNETEDILKARHGRGTEVACIGVAGEKLSLISCIMNDKGRAAGRSGVGAVMGSKKVKAIAVKGKMEVPMANPKLAQELRAKYLKEHGGLFDFFHETGTPGIAGSSAQSGDSPVKNWGGAGTVDFKEGIKNFAIDEIMKFQDKRYGCWRCSMACGGHWSVKDGPFKGVAHHKPEYETIAAFGTMNLMPHTPALIKLNEICNRAGLDTISTGCTISFVIECFENGVLTLEDTDGIPMNWGNHQSIIAMTEKLAKREGFGDLIADGVKKATERIGKDSAKYAIHVNGQELPMHDPRFDPAMATTFLLDATPGRHTQGNEGLFPPGLDLKRGDKYVYSGKGELHKTAASLMHVVNAAGICQFGYFSYPIGFLTDFMTAITGKKWDIEECKKAGERIGTLRHAFNLREGHNPLKRNVPQRMIGVPPLKEGNLKGVTVDLNTLAQDYLKALDWDTKTTVPSKKKLEWLGLSAVAKDLKPVA
ncbi:MAG: aldehyde ferredoxin oxidoreductase family protein [Chloroflexota bacterium]|nr:aldehyde ferredoxin oxidoreductase family protein [Chloroflexota bacterium]